MNIFFMLNVSDGWNMLSCWYALLLFVQASNCKQQQLPFLSIFYLFSVLNWDERWPLTVRWGWGMEAVVGWCDGTR